MSHKDNQDLRIREGGGWFWGEHELFTVFAPIIGPAGVSVYIAMARMIPLAAIDFDKQIRVRRVSEFSCVGKSKCAEEIRTLIKLGMILETKYLDGREPTYKLASLRELAKLGQKQLLTRLGVPNTDTAPFDQTVKNRRERERRLAKGEETSAVEAQQREVPLFDQDEAEEGNGVHPADTTDDREDSGDGDRNTDTVSAKTPSVSAEMALVSAKNAPVSAGADTFKEREEKKRLRAFNPLPPAAQGDVGFDDPDQARPKLPSEHCTVVDAGFLPAMPIAARWVMAELGITARRMQQLIEAQMLMFCKRNRNETLEDVAAKMARQGRLLHEHSNLLAHRPWGWDKFFGHGHWSRPLPYATGVTPNDAAIGAHTKQKGAPEDLESYLRTLAERLPKRPFLPPTATALMELASRAAALDTPDLRTALEQIEEEMYEAGLAHNEEHRAFVDRRVEAEIAETKKRYRGMTEEQATRTRESLRRRILFATYDLPRLFDPILLSRYGKPCV